MLSKYEMTVWGIFLLEANNKTRQPPHHFHTTYKTAPVSPQPQRKSRKEMRELKFKERSQDGRAGGTESEPRRAQLSPRTFSLASSREAYRAPYPNCLRLTVYLASAESGCGLRESGSSDRMTTCSRVEGLPKMRP